MKKSYLNVNESLQFDLLCHNFEKFVKTYRYGSLSKDELFGKFFVKWTLPELSTKVNKGLYGNTCIRPLILKEIKDKVREGPYFISGLENVRSIGICIIV